MTQPDNRYGRRGALSGIRTGVLVFVCLLNAAVVRSQTEDPAPEPSGSADSFWIVSTRNLSSSLAYSDSLITPSLLHYNAADGWQRSSLSEFQQTEAPGTVTLIYIHGNRIEWSNAVNRGWTARRALVDRRRERPPVRFVIWSWPSNQVRGPLRDVRAKADRADAECAFLARFLTTVLPDSQVSLIGSSYGARIITGALHLRSGGRFAGLVAPAAIHSAPVRVVLQAAAIDNDWLLPGHAHGRALNQTDALLLFYNSRDPVLKRYRFLERCRSPEALGYTGSRGLNCLPRVRQRDVSGVIGKTHAEISYFETRGLMALASDYLLWETVE